jgi:hypothetical protein
VAVELSLISAATGFSSARSRNVTPANLKQKRTVEAAAAADLMLVLMLAADGVVAEWSCAFLVEPGFDLVLRLANRKISAPVSSVQFRSPDASSDSRRVSLRFL